MLSFLFKPKWQHRDEAVRAAAVATLRDAELSKALPRLALEDPSEAVRLAALDRLNDRSLLLRAALKDPAESLRLRMRKRLLKDLLAAPDAASAEFEPLLADADVETIERIAIDARAASLRRIALSRIERAGLLADRALADPDPEIRLWLAGRIPPGASMERLLEGARTRDKRVYKLIKDKLDTQRKSEGSPALIEAEALGLCRKLEALLREVPTDALAQASAIEAAWNAFGNAAPVALQARFSGTLQTLRRAIEDIHNPRPAVVATEPAPTEATQPASSTEPAAVIEPVDESPDAELSALVEAATAAVAEAYAVETTLESLRGRTTKRWNAVPHNAANQALKTQLDTQLQALRERCEAQAKQRQEQQLAFKQALDALSEALDADNVHAARQADAQISALLKAQRKLDQGSDSKRYAALKQRLNKLGDWQRWSNNEARVQLCAEMEALPGLGLHPDALSAKVKELQQRFNKLDQLDGLSPEKAKEQGLSRRFRALGYAALKPAKGFFEKRAEVRTRHSDDIATQISEVEAMLAAEPVDVPALIARKRALSDSFRELDRTDPTRRADLAKQMKTLLERISQAVDASFASVRAEKEKLIAQLKLKIKHAPRAEAIELIKSTQQRFKQAGRGQRASDQALWDELKATADPVFAAQKAEREAQDSAAAEQVQAQRELIAAVQALAVESLAHPGAAAQGLADLDTQWRAFGETTAELERDYQRAIDAVDRAVAQARQQRAQDRQQLLHDKANHVAQIEQRVLGGEQLDVDAERARWSALAPLEEAVELKLGERLERALSGTIDLGTLEANALEAQRLALLIEYLESRPSPEAYAAARMEFQVKRLAAHLGGTASAKDQELAEAQQAFHLLGPLLPAVRQDVLARVRPGS